MGIEPGPSNSNPTACHCPQVTDFIRHKSQSLRQGTDNIIILWQGILTVPNFLYAHANRHFTSGFVGGCSCCSFIKSTISTGWLFEHAIRNFPNFISASSSVKAYIYITRKVQISNATTCFYYLLQCKINVIIFKAFLLPLLTNQSEHIAKVIFANNFIVSSWRLRLHCYADLAISTMIFFYNGYIIRSFTSPYKKMSSSLTHCNFQGARLIIKSERTFKSPNK